MRRCLCAFAIVAASIALPLASGAQSSGGLVNLSAPRGREQNREYHRAKLMKGLLAPQSAPGDDKVTAEVKKSDAAAATRSFYLGTQVGYSFTENGDFASGLVASGSVLYSVIHDSSEDQSKVRFFLPVRGNLSSLNVPLDDETKSKLNALVASPGGLQVAVEPYVLLPKVATHLHPQLFASAGWRLSSAKDANDTTRYLPQGRVVLGSALGIGPSEAGAYPLWLEIAGSWTKFASDSYKQLLGSTASASAKAITGTIIAPVAQNAALLTEVFATKGERPVWRVGLVFMGGDNR